MTPTTDFVQQQAEERDRLARAAIERRCNWLAAGIGILIAVAIFILIF